MVSTYFWNSTTVESILLQWNWFYCSRIDSTVVEFRKNYSTAVELMIQNIGVIIDRSVQEKKFLQLSTWCNRIPKNWFFLLVSIQMFGWSVVMVERCKKFFSCTDRSIIAPILRIINSIVIENFFWFSTTVELILLQ